MFIGVYECLQLFIDVFSFLDVYSFFYSCL